MFQSVQLPYASLIRKASLDSVEISAEEEEQVRLLPKSFVPRVPCVSHLLISKTREVRGGRPRHCERKRERERERKRERRSKSGNRGKASATRKERRSSSSRARVIGSSRETRLSRVNSRHLEAKIASAWACWYTERRSDCTCAVE